MCCFFFFFFFFTFLTISIANHTKKTTVDHQNVCGIDDDSRIHDHDGNNNNRVTHVHMHSIRTQIAKCTEQFGSFSLNCSIVLGLLLLFARRFLRVQLPNEQNEKKKWTTKKDRELHIHICGVPANSSLLLSVLIDYFFTAVLFSALGWDDVDDGNLKIKQTLTLTCTHMHTHKQTMRIINK